MKDEALRLALEYITQSGFQTGINEVITAIKQALAQPEPEDYPTYDGYIKKALEQLNPPCKTGSQCTSKCDGCAEQEPVAYWYQSRLGNGYFTDTKANPDPDWKETPLYTHPPKREWHGLTDEEIELAFYEFDNARSYIVSFARAIEAKLKEKNSA